MIGLEFDIDHCCHWEKPCLAAPPSLGPCVEPPCRVQSGWERNALGCRAAATGGNRRNNSPSMDSNDPYLHLSKFASKMCVQPGVSAVLLAELLHVVLTWRVRSSHGVFSPACELCAKASADFNHRLPSVNPVVPLFFSWLIFFFLGCTTVPTETKAATDTKKKEVR